ncbi:hypothetical protein E4T49_03861 [Aureobasidium sp. EXF-10728]|nr:hypothetical protein E4T49_03861 [Aureobasidium sp. EXF-10728]
MASLTLVSSDPSLSISSDDKSTPCSPTFTGLPTELKKMIVNNAEDSCLPNLSLVSKELDDLATKPFGERCLAQRRFMVTEYSLQGLVDLTAHAKFELLLMSSVEGPCVRKVLFNTYMLTADGSEWLESRSKQSSKNECILHELIPSSVIGNLFLHLEQAFKNVTLDRSSHRKLSELLKQAFSNLKSNGQRVTIGLFDDVLRRNSRYPILRKAYGFDEFWQGLDPVAELTHAHWKPEQTTIFALMQKAANQSGMPLLFLELDLPYRCERDLEGLLVETFLDGRTPPHDFEICTKVGTDSECKLKRVGPGRLSLSYHGTTVKSNEEDLGPNSLLYAEPGAGVYRFVYDTGSASFFGPHIMLLRDVVRAEMLQDIHIKSCALQSMHFLGLLCIFGSARLYTATILDIHIFDKKQDNVDQKKIAWPLVKKIKDRLAEKCPNLRHLIMEQVFYYKEDDPSIRAVVVDQRCEWEGVHGVLAGLDTLISNMTALDEEQRERWSMGEIDADGNDLVEQE